MQEAQKDAVSAFDDFMDQQLESAWAKERGTLVNAIMPIGNAASKRQAPRSTPSPRSTSTKTLMLPAANGRYMLLPTTRTQSWQMQNCLPMIPQFLFICSFIHAINASLHCLYDDAKQTEDTWQPSIPDT